MLDILRQSRTYQSLLSVLPEDGCQLRTDGLRGASTAYCVSALLQDMPDTTFLIATQSQEEAEKMVQDLDAFSSSDLQTEKKDEIFLFPQWQGFLRGSTLPSREVLADRMLSLERLIHGHRSIVVTCVRSLMQRILPPAAFREATLHFAAGEEIELNQTMAQLVHNGYQRVDMVEMKGDFALRGGILDLYPLSYDTPIRIELFGDEIDSIRQFDPISQRSTAHLENEVWVVPMSEIILTPEIIEHWREKTSQISAEHKSPKLTNEINRLTASLEEYGRFDGIEAYLPLLYPHTATLWDYLPQETVAILNGPNWMKMEGEKLLDQANTFFQRESELDHLAIPPSEMFTSFDEVMDACKEKRTIWALNSGQPISDVEYPEFAFKMRSFDGLRGNFPMFLKEMEEWTSKGYSVTVMSDNDKQAERMRSVLTEREIDLVAVRVGAISEGFVSDDLKLALISDDEMFGRHRQRKRHRKFKEGIPISSFLDLKVGDYVVHVTHGIGTYGGIKPMKIEGRTQDFLMISYAGTDVLYVPTHQMGMVQKYVGGDNARVSVDKLGGTSWNTVPGILESPYGRDFKARLFA